MTNINARYTEEMASDLVNENEDRIFESIRDYIVDNIEFKNVGKSDFEIDSFFEHSDTKILFNLENEEIYEYKEGTVLNEKTEKLIQNGKIVSVYDFSLEYLDAFIEHALIAKDDENAELKIKYKSGQLTKEEYLEEIELLAYDRYIDEYVNTILLTIDYMNSI